jgi:UDP-2-acetamido-3-amino-2,3-dideoxy-glucuronate N-acetyltransferase
MNYYIDNTTKMFSRILINEGVYIGPFCVLGISDEREPLSIKNAIVRNDKDSTDYIRIDKNTYIQSSIFIGNNTHLGTNVWCEHGCYIGCNSKIGQDCQIMYGARIYDRVVIGNNSWIGGFVCNDSIIGSDCIVMGNLIHKFINATEGIPEAAPILHDKVFIGMNAMVIGGIEIECGAYIAAGAVLTKSAKKNRLYLGNPAVDSGVAPDAFKKI